MYRRVCAICILSLSALLSLYPAKSFAAADGNDMMAECSAAVQFADSGQATKNLMLASYCLGLMDGIMDLSLAHKWNKDSTAYICLPDDGIKNIQAARIVLKYLRDNPNKLQAPGSFLAIKALSLAYPCHK